jgi:hypothetical protein
MAVCAFSPSNGWKALSAANRKILESEGYVTKNMFLDNGYTRVSW